jgi:alpha-methylacyl-CoA racemase
MTAPTGPLAGLKVLEFGGIGPVPFACMLLSDMGADVVTLERPDFQLDRSNVVARGRTVVLVDLKDSTALPEVLSLADAADVLVEGFRPGVMERLGLGPETLLARNPGLIYGRMTGWGQEGPLALSAGHDINYIAITGALHAIGAAGGPPVPPLNLLGDYGGGSLYLLAGILAALHEVGRSGEGQVVDAAITDGVLSMMSSYGTLERQGLQSDRRGSNLLDGGAPFYGVFPTSDGKFVSFGAVEPKFFSIACERLSLEPSWTAAQYDRAQWPALRDVLARVFVSRSQAEWVQLLEGTDTCFAPVLTFGEARKHPHNAARGAFERVGDEWHPAPAPRFSRTASQILSPPPRAPTSLADVSDRWRGAQLSSCLHDAAFGRRGRNAPT